MKFKKSNITVTPKKAAEFLRHNTYEGQRNKSPRHIQELGEKLVDGRFHNGQVALIYNGSTWLADGQHQCEASIVTGKSFPATLLEFTAEDGDTKEDVAEVFAQFNVDRSRSRGDIAWIYGCQIGMETWPRKCVTLCNTALGWLASNCGNYNGKSTLTKDESARLLSKKRKACEFVHDMAFQGADGAAKHLLRSPTVAAMIATFEKSHADAEVFWAAVRDGDMLKRTDPCFVLREFLLRSNVALGGGARSGDVTVSQREMFAKCIHAWNAYRQKKTTSLKYYADKPLPKLA